MRSKPHIKFNPASTQEKWNFHSCGFNFSFLECLLVLFLLRNVLQLVKNTVMSARHHARDMNNISLCYKLQMGENFLKSGYLHDGKHGGQIFSIAVRSTYFFRHLKNWFPHVVQFLASTLASFYMNWHMVFLVHEWASIYKSGEVSTPSSVMCDIPLRSTRIGRNKWRKYMYTYFLFTELSNWFNEWWT